MVDSGKTKVLATMLSCCIIFPLTHSLITCWYTYSTSSIEPILVTPCLLFLSWIYMDMKISHFGGLLIQWNRQHQILLSCIVIYRCPEPLVLCRQLTVSIWSQCHLFYPVWYICPFVFCHYPRYPMFWHYKCTTYIAHKTVLHAAKLSLPRDSIWRTRN